MKRLFSLVLTSALLLIMCACGGKETSSEFTASLSSDESTSTVGGMGLFDNISVFSTTDSQDTESEEKVESEASQIAETKSEESKSKDTQSKDTESNDTESKDTESKNTESTTSSKPKDRNKVKPSTIPNPTGIKSSGRKNNSGSDWEMTLVNPWNTLNKNYSVNLDLLDSRFGEGKYFDARAIGHLEDMCEAAAEDGVNLWVISAHRTYEYQQMLFDAELAEYKSYNPGCSEDEAINGAASVVARPGTSEHNLGLAVDFNSVEQSFENTAQYRWLKKHCTKYGFIMRYAADKQDATGVIYEPWHYRYVGVENAKKIAESGLCLEEYIKNN